MPRYYESESLIDFVKQNTPHMNGETTMKCVEFAIKNAPTADVVPKSEYDRLEKLFNDMTQEAKGYLNSLYGIRAEVAREIFDDIKCSILAMSTLALFSYTDNLEESNAKQKCYKYVSELIDELDKRYAEGEPNGN